ncbi:MAG: IS21 family transposase [Pseudonocardiaceae bacterium]
MELYEVIRKERRDEGASIRELARRHGVHRRTVREALECAVPPRRKAPERVSSALGPYEATVRKWLTEDLEAPRKQRHTARRVYQRLRDECGARVAESTVRARVAEIKSELGGSLRDVTVPQVHGPGEEAEVDFGELYATVAGVLMRLWMFAMRLSHSGRAFHVIFAHQAQEAFFEGHVLAFAHFGGVPARARYDNLKNAVTRILIGRDRVENERLIRCGTRYGFDSFFCEPGQKGAHEKGGVEGEVGRFRRSHLVPVPEVADLDELNRLCAAADAADDARHIGRRAESVGEAFAAEAAWLHPLPEAPFDAAKEYVAKADAKARVCVAQSWYSVPVRLARREVVVRLGARRVEAVHAGTVVACHARSLHKGSQTLELDHYLEILMRKPGALAGSVTLAQARQAGSFTDAHQRFWDAARRRLGDAEGARALIDVLWLHRRMAAEEVVAGIEGALAAGSADPALVAIEARRAVDAPLARVIPIEAGLAGCDRPAPSLGGYDDLLQVPALPAQAAGDAR